MRSNMILPLPWNFILAMLYIIQSSSFSFLLNFLFRPPGKTQFWQDYWDQSKFEFQQASQLFGATEIFIGTTRFAIFNLSGSNANLWKKKKMQLKARIQANQMHLSGCQIGKQLKQFMCHSDSCYEESYSCNLDITR